MIFSTRMARLILEGHKTQTRRLARDPVVRIVRRNRRTYTTRPFTPIVGKSYAVQLGRGKPEQFRIVCTAARRELLGQLAGDDAYDDVRAEGFPRFTDFARYWLQLREPGWPRIENVWCPACLLDVDFEPGYLVCPTCDGTEEVQIRPRATDTEVIARFTDRWAATVVWVITFKLARAAPQLYLAAETQHIGDYTTSPAQAVQEPVIDMDGKLRSKPVEAVDPEIVEQMARLSAAEHAERFQAQINLDRRLLSQEDRAAKAQRAAQTNGVRIHSERRALDRLLAQRQRNPDAIENAVRRLEQKAHPRATGARHAA